MHQTFSVFLALLLHFILCMHFLFVLNSQQHCFSFNFVNASECVYGLVRSDYAKDFSLLLNSHFSSFFIYFFSSFCCTQWHFEYIIYALIFLIHSTTDFEQETCRRRCRARCSWCCCYCKKRFYVLFMFRLKMHTSETQKKMLTFGGQTWINLNERRICNRKFKSEASD